MVSSDYSIQSQNQFWIPPLVFVAGVSGPPYGLYYNIVDLKLQNGLGEVTQKNIQIDPSPRNDGLMAVKHGNGKDWWLVKGHDPMLPLRYNK
ncbi:MAG: hypothetical protein IPO63_08675 [Bacteroidetes bacterium]|nr:hypothetical protein [Bacteroidota bacterium]